MGFLEITLLIIGIALCTAALIPLGLWTAQSWTTFKHNQVQFRASNELLRQQILAANAERVASQTNKTPSLSNSVVATQPAESELAVAPATEPETTQKAGVPSGTQKEIDPVVGTDGTWKGFRKFQVDRLVKETANCTSVYLTPVDGNRIASFNAGQHLPLRFQIPGEPKPVIRCYSLSDGPGKSQYRISVKAMSAREPDHEPGLVSNYVNHQLQQGDVIEARAPSGSFYLDLDDSRPVVLLAGGIGITPMISMIESIQAHSPDRVTLLCYGVVNRTEHAFFDEIRAFEKKNKNLHVVSCYSNPQPEDVQGKEFQVKGFVTTELIKRLMPNPDCQFYLCGPPPFMQSLNDGLKSWGVNEKQIHSEAFGPASIKKPEPDSSTAASIGTVEVVFDASGKTVVWDPACESLLELAESNGLEIDSGCRAGSCGTCATDLLSGKVEYPEGTHVDCEPGQCLTCVARPSGSIKLGA